MLLLTLPFLECFSHAPKVLIPYVASLSLPPESSQRLIPVGTPGPGVWSYSPGPCLDLGQLSGISQDSASVSFTFFLISVHLF